MNLSHDGAGSGTSKALNAAILPLLWDITSQPYLKDHPSGEFREVKGGAIPHDLRESKPDLDPNFGFALV